MPSFRGLPKVDDILKSSDGSISPKSSQLTPPPENGEGKLVKMEIIAIDKVYSPQITKLSVNPTTVSERKASNWVKHNIPGQSDPLLQWINGSSRVVSFTAIVSKDLKENLTVGGVDSLDNVKVKVKDSYGKFGNKEINGSGISTKEGRLLESLQPDPNTNLEFGGLAARDNSKATNFWFRSITPYLEYYRSLVIPRSSNLKDRSKTPPLIQLKMGSILGNEDISSRDKWVLESYSITITKMSPDLKPIEATVGFTFIEYVDKSKEVNVDNALDKLSSEESTTSAKTDNFIKISTPVDSRKQVFKTPEGVLS